MYVVLSAEVWIGKYKFTRIHDIEIERSGKTLEDIARIKLPTTALLTRAGEYATEVETAKVFKVGDTVMIRLGYNGNLRTEFEGYVSKVKSSERVEVECMDAVWLLRQKNCKQSWRNTDLKSVIEFIVHGTGVKLHANVPVIQFEQFYLRNVNAAAALYELKQKYGLLIYMEEDNQTLFVGLAYPQSKDTIIYGMGDNIAGHDLEFVQADNVKLKIKAILLLKNNTRKEAEYGDPDGELKTIHFYTLKSGESLETLAKAEAEKYKFNGYRGTLTGFLEPQVKRGQTARIRDTRYPEHNGDYLVDKVVTTFGTGGARRKVSLGIKYK
jgi:hypothetical protein